MKLLIQAKPRPGQAQARPKMGSRMGLEAAQGSRIGLEAAQGSRMGLEAAQGSRMGLEAAQGSRMGLPGPGQAQDRPRPGPGPKMDHFRSLKSGPKTALKSIDLEGPKKCQKYYNYPI